MSERGLRVTFAVSCLVLSVGLSSCAESGGLITPTDTVQSTESTQWTQLECLDDQDCLAQITIAEQCRSVTCDPIAHRCRVDLAEAGSVCDDGNPCTVGDGCAQGVCAPGEPVPATPTPGSDCLVDVCDSETGETVTRRDAGMCRERFGPGGLCWAWSCVDECEGEDCREGVCRQALFADGEVCNDADDCTIGDHCAAGECLGTPVCDCETDFDCLELESTCQGSYRCVDWTCVPLGDGLRCVDAGDECRANVCLEEKGSCAALLTAAGEACGPESEGVCSPNAVCLRDGCGCRTDTDCLLFDDGDPCNGEQRCLLQPGGQRCCAIDPATIPVCPPEGEEGGCVRWRCDSVSGACVEDEPLPDDTPCDDGDRCTDRDHCNGSGACVGGEELCHECREDADCAFASAGDACAPAMVCVTEPWPPRCQPVEGSGVACDTDADTQCARATCDPSDGQCYLQAIYDGTVCDDGDPCTPDDRCVAGLCVAGEGPAPSCDDANPCTRDECVPGTGCVHLATDGVDCAIDDVEDACVETTCRGGACIVIGLLACDDGDSCTSDACDPELGCVSETIAGAACDDGDLCTLADTCDAEGRCVGTPRACSDGDPCTTDTCDGATGECVFPSAPGGTVCDDRDPCTVSDVCVAGDCHGSPKVCDDRNACTAGICSPESGACMYVDISGDCDDGDPCTTDSCAPMSGCVHALVPNCCGNGVVESGEACDAGPEHDGDACTAECAWRDVTLGQQGTDLTAAGLGNGSAVVVWRADGQVVAQRLVQAGPPEGEPTVLAPLEGTSVGPFAVGATGSGWFVYTYADRTADGDVVRFHVGGADGTLSTAREVAALDPAYKVTDASVSVRGSATTRSVMIVTLEAPRDGGASTQVWGNKLMAQRTVGGQWVWQAPLRMQLLTEALEAAKPEVVSWEDGSDVVGYVTRDTAEGVAVCRLLSLRPHDSLGIGVDWVRAQNYFGGDGVHCHAVSLGRRGDEVRTAVTWLGLGEEYHAVYVGLVERVALGVGTSPPRAVPGARTGSLPLGLLRQPLAAEGRELLVWTDPDGERYASLEGATLPTTHVPLSVDVPSAGEIGAVAPWDSERALVVWKDGENQIRARVLVP